MRFCFIFVLLLVLPCSGCGGGRVEPTAGGKTSEHWLTASQNPDPKARVEAIRKLGNIGAKDEAALNAVFDALNDSEPRVRKEAIFAVVRNKKELASAIPVLARMSTEDKDPEIRKLAGESYSNLAN